MACQPDMDLYLVMKSFMHLFSAVPMWMAPLENGGPSCRSKMGLPSVLLSISW